ncbi:MAG: hypothetical protein ABI333_19020 [bacterium]
MPRRSNLMVPFAAFVLLCGVPLACEGGSVGESVCDDGLDNDGDGLTDCDDPDCADADACTGCGNGVVDGDEECDGSDFGGEWCETWNTQFVGGDLTCLPNCVIDTAHCTLPECGNNLAEGTEECDGYDMGDSADCAQQGFLGGHVLCDNDTCTYDLSGCFMEVTCDDIAPTGENDVCIGAPSQGGNYNWRYLTFIDLGGPRGYAIIVELWGDYVAGGITTGSHQLGVGADANYATCAYCALLIECADPDCNNAMKYFMPLAGTLQLDEIGLANAGDVRGSLSDVNWKEVTINPETADSTPVPAGPCFNLTSPVTLSASVLQPAG